MTDFGCQPACVPCRKAGLCKGTPNTDTHPGMYYPNREADTPLACGCKIPWPIIKAFGQNIHGQILCSIHGWQHELTKADLERSRKAVKKIKAGELPLCPF
jgi:hypothetical protein